MTQRRPTVLVVEDESAIAELLSANLRHNGFTPRWAADGAAARRAVDAALPDLVLLDWMLPDESGPQLTRHWRARERTRLLPIILLTARDAEADRVAGLDAGADDYLGKPFSVRELLARIRALLRRRAPDPHGAVVTVGGLALDADTHQVVFAGAPIRLGPTEFRLLQHLMRNAERVQSRARLLEQVWRDPVTVEERTVDVHVKRLREALGPAGAMIETVRGAGYRITAAPSSAVF